MLSTQLYSKPVKLSDRVLERLAEMVSGDDPLFPYRTGSALTRFFHRCGFNYNHDGFTRKWWTKNRLDELNLGVSQPHDLPSDGLLQVISELFDPIDFDEVNLKLEPALNSLNRILARDGLAAYLDASERCHVRNTGTGVNSSAIVQKPRPLSKEEIAQRTRLTEFLNSASEDDFIERLLVPFFQGLGFYRVSPTGHKDKILEFGKDLWMKYWLPTGHWIYFCAQVKREKIDSSATPSRSNAATVLNQAQMAIEHPIFDPDANQKVLLDHLYIISAGEITKAAKSWIAERLDAGQRRHIIFMDREDFLNQAARILRDLHLQDSKDKEADSIPF
jgi:hypothetical protein